MAAILGWTSAQNALVHEAAKMLRESEVNTDDAVVRLQVSLATWAPEGNIRLLRTRAAELAKAVEGWGSCEVSEVSGDERRAVAEHRRDPQRADAATLQHRHADLRGRLPPGRYSGSRRGELHLPELRRER